MKIEEGNSTLNSQVDDITANVSKMSISKLLFDGRRLAWSVAVALSTILIIASVGDAQKRPAATRTPDAERAGRAMGATTAHLRYRCNRDQTYFAELEIEQGNCYEKTVNGKVLERAIHLMKPLREQCNSGPT